MFDKTGQDDQGPWQGDQDDQAGQMVFTCFLNCPSLGLLMNDETDIKSDQHDQADRIDQVALIFQPPPSSSAAKRLFIVSIHPHSPVRSWISNLNDILLHKSISLC